MISLKEAYEALLDDPGQVFVYDQGTVKEFSRYPDLLMILPGSFNPIHDAHKWLYESAKDRYDAYDSQYYEMSISRVDKPPVSVLDLEERLKKMPNKTLITNAPRMIQKIGLLVDYCCNLEIFCGVDTIIRMADDYSQIGIGGLNAAFYVTDRIMNGEVVSYSSLDWKSRPDNIVKWKTPPEHLLSVSSTAIRNQWNEKMNEAAKAAASTASEMMREETRKIVRKSK